LIRVALLYGGRTGEHHVSRCSAASVARSIDRSSFEVIPVGIDLNGIWHVQEDLTFLKDDDFGEILAINESGPWHINHYENNGKLVFSKEGRSIEADVAFPVMHGTFSEDGTLQGLLELAMVPFVGASMIASAMGMDKEISKEIAVYHKIPVVTWITLTYEEFSSGKDIKTDINEKIGYPLFIKPVNAGSSVGVVKVNSEDEFLTGCEEAFLYDNRVLIETGLAVDEIECAVLGNIDAEASITGRVIPTHEFYSYEAKYIDPQGAGLEIPADIPVEKAEKIRKYAVDIFKALHCRGLARVDFFIEKESGDIYFNEINTMPGFTSISMYPKLWEASGVSYSDLITRLIELAQDDYRRRSRLIQEFH
jgi:D-alanine-D-alanine ligase